MWQPILTLPLEIKERVSPHLHQHQLLPNLSIFANPIDQKLYAHILFIWAFKMMTKANAFFPALIDFFWDTTIHRLVTIVKKNQNQAKPGGVPIGI